MYFIEIHQQRTVKNIFLVFRKKRIYTEKSNSKTKKIWKKICNPQFFHLGWNKYLLVFNVSVAFVWNDLFNLPYYSFFSNTVNIIRAIKRKRNHFLYLRICAWSVYARFWQKHRKTVILKLPSYRTRGYFYLTDNYIRL